MNMTIPQTVDDLLKDWHEARRASFQSAYPNLDYDSPAYAKTAKDRSKYICLDNGTSGAFILEKSTGRIFGIKGYGTIDRRKFVGILGHVTGANLLAREYMKPNLKSPLKETDPTPCAKFPV